jgi:hypothetical protein
MIGKKFSDEFETHHRTFDQIITSINNALRRSLLKKMFNQGITSMRGFWNYQNNVWDYNAD